MGRLYPILAALWTALFALFLAVWSEWLKGPHALETVQKILSSNLRWLGAALVVFTVATLWSYFKSKDEESRQKIQAIPTQVSTVQHNGAATVPHQLRAPRADFVGRHDEIKELVAAVQRGGVTISGLRGQGGIGKTELAYKLAEILKPGYPDGQIYLDLKGIRHEGDRPDQTPLTPAHAMAHVIWSYDNAVQLPDDDARLQALYQTVLTGKRALLLMDNARDKDQVEPLTPPPGCVMLVTSRQGFTLAGLLAKDLDILPPDRSRELLLTIAPRIGDRADELAQLCGYLPEALRNAASFIKTRSDFSPDNFLNRMRDAQQRLKLTGVELSLTTSSELLNPDLRFLWYQLAVFPDSFDRPAAAALWEVQPDAAQDTLSDLSSKYSLIEWNAERYRLHDLARDFTASYLEDPTRAGAQNRHAAYYKNVLADADRLYLQGGAATGQGLALFDTEWANIRTGQAWAAANAAVADSAARLCVEYPDAGAYVLFLRLHPRERIGWLETAVRAARQLGDRQGEGDTLGNLSNAYHALGDYRRAIQLLGQHLAIARELGDRRGEASTLGNLGNAYHTLGEYRRAIEFHEQHLAIARELGDRKGEGGALGNLGLAYRRLGEYRRAIEFHEQHLAIARKLGDRQGEANALGSLGNAYHALGEYRRAIEFHEQHRAIAREIGDRQGEANALLNGAIALAKLGKQAEAIPRAESALKIFEQIESPDAATTRAALAEWRNLK